MNLRHLLPLVLLGALCQCSSLRHDVLPVVHPGTDEVVAFTVRNSHRDTVRPSDFMAALEDVQEELTADNKANRGYAGILGLTDAKTQNAALFIGGPQGEVETKSGRKVTILIPTIRVVTNQLPPATVQATMPKIQSYCYRLLARHMVPVKLSELKRNLKKS